jgi:predicted Zn-dependent protease
MSPKTFIKVFLLLAVIAGCGLFIFLKVEVLGDPNSNFNQTTRFKLGGYPIVRTILGLHSAGDAREEYFYGKGPIQIVWFAPETENIDQSALQKFADLVSTYTGRQVQLVGGGAIDDTTLQLSNLHNQEFKNFAVASGASPLFVFFTEDYAPRPDQEISTTYLEAGMVISLNAHRQFLQGYTQYMNNYLLSSMLHEFGHQIGLNHNSDPACIMDAHAGINGHPQEADGLQTPQDFCPAEQAQIAQLKL